MASSTTRIRTSLSKEAQDAVLFWPIKQKIAITKCDSANRNFNFRWKNGIDYNKIDYTAKLANGDYDNGIALVLGKTLDGCKYPYCFALDFDGIDSTIAFFGSWDNVISLSKKTRIEWHQEIGRLHIVFFCDRNVTKKDITINNDHFEVRTDDLLVSSPSIHQSGNPWTVLGTEEIAFLPEMDLTELEVKIDSLSLNLDNSGYVSDEKREAYIKSLDDPNTTIKEGHRHNSLVSLGCSYFFRYKDEWKDLTDDQRYERLKQVNQTRCKPPCSDRELDTIWDSIVKRYRKTRDIQHEEIRERQRLEQINLEGKNAKQRLEYDVISRLGGLNSEAHIAFKRDFDYWTVVSENPLKFIAVSKKRGCICRISISYPESTDNANTETTTRRAHVDYGTVIIRLKPTKIVMYQSPLDFLEMSPQYRITFEDTTATIKKQFVLTGSIESIVTELKEREGYVVSSYGVTEALRSVIGAFKDDGKLEIDQSVTFEGYYLHDGEIKISKINFDQKHPVRTKQECLSCAQYLEERSKYQIWEYNGVKIDRRDLLASLIKWAIPAPFNFALKQSGCPKPYLKGFDMTGERDGGKSGLTAEILNMHGNPTHEQDPNSIYSIAASSINTEAKFGKAISMSTYEKEISEFRKVEEYGRNEEFVGLFITSIDGLTARRGRDEKSGRYDAPFPSCSPLIINGNPFFSEKGEVVKRFHIQRFSKEDRHTNDPNSPFNVFQRQNKDKLKILGDWTMRYIFENRAELLLSKKYNPYQIGEIALKAFYENIGLQVPEWLTWWVKDTVLEELDYDEESLVRSILYNHVHKTIRDNYRLLDADDLGNINLEQRIELCLNRDLWPWIRKYESFEKRAGDYCIDTSIKELFSYRLPNMSFKKLAEITGFEYTKDRNGLSKMVCSQKQLIDFIEGNSKFEEPK